MSRLNLLAEYSQVQTAIELIELGARVQTLEDITSLTRGRLVRLYKEVSGKSPVKGMLPYSTDWFLTWQPNIHASLFLAYFNRLQGMRDIAYSKALATAYKLYAEHVAIHDSGNDEPVMTFTRAWMLTRFIESKQLDTGTCTDCGLPFVMHAYTPTNDFKCGVCNPPSRAGIPNKKEFRDQPALAS